MWQVMDSCSTHIAKMAIYSVLKSHSQRVIFETLTYEGVLNILESCQSDICFRVMTVVLTLDYVLVLVSADHNYLKPSVDLAHIC